MDWSNGAILPNYVKASANTRLVGKQLSMLLKGLIEKNGLSPKKMHLIGFSLGAHVAGFAGAELGNLSRITGKKTIVLFFIPGNTFRASTTTVLQEFYSAVSL